MALATSTILASLAIGAAGYSTTKALTQKVPKAPKVEELPKPPKLVDPNISDAVRRQRRTSTAGGRSSTLLTGPAGLKSEPGTQRKTLLGY